MSHDLAQPFVELPLPLTLSRRLAARSLKGSRSSFCDVPSTTNTKMADTFLIRVCGVDGLKGIAECVFAAHVFQPVFRCAGFAGADVACAADAEASWCGGDSRAEVRVVFCLGEREQQTYFDFFSWLV